MTLKQIAERFEKFLNNDIEGLGKDEKKKLTNCCVKLREYSDKIDNIVFDLHHIRYSGLIKEWERMKVNGESGEVRSKE